MKRGDFLRSLLAIPAAAVAAKQVEAEEAVHVGYANTETVDIPEQFWTTTTNATSGIIINNDGTDYNISGNTVMWDPNTQWTYTQ